MATLDTTAAAQDIILEDIKHTDTGTELARELQKQAKGLQDVHDAQEKIREQTWAVTMTPPEDPIDYPAVSSTLTDTARQIQVTVGDTQIGDLEPGVAGQAMQGQEGSSIVDVAAAMPEGQGNTVIDVTMLGDAVKHEKRHERQNAAPDTTVIDVGNGQTLDWHQLSEADAMAGQETVQWVSGEYKQIYHDVFSLTTPDRLREAMDTGNVEELGEEIREKQSVMVSVSW